MACARRVEPSNRTRACPVLIGRNRYHTKAIKSDWKPVVRYRCGGGGTPLSRPAKSEKQLIFKRDLRQLHGGHSTKWSGV
jgi:hypothetical protein